MTGLASMETTSTGFYTLLGVQKNCSSEEIRSAYKKQALKWHPDRWSTDPSAAEQAKLRFQQIQEAYAVLSDETKRALYDAGMYDSYEDTDAFCDFLDEISSLMANVRFQRNEEEELKELQEMYIKMLQEDWFSSEDIISESPSNTDHQKRVVGESQYATEDKHDPFKFNPFLHHERSTRKQ